METVKEREERIARLEAERAQRQSETVWPTPDDAGTGVSPIEIAPGRGDLTYSSGFYPTFPTALSLVGHRAVSFARIFMSQPWVAAAVMRMLTWSMRPPLKVYRRTGSDPTDRVLLGPGEHPLADAIQNPWLGGSTALLVQSLLGPKLVNGNSVTPVRSGANDVIEFDPKDWRYTRPIMPWRGSVEGWEFDVDNPTIMETVSADQVLHIADWSPTGPIGVSPLQQLGVTLQIEDAAQRYQRALFQNGARAPSAITASEQFLGIKGEERRAIMKQLREDIDTIYGGPDNSGRPALLPPGLDWKPIGQTTVEAELINQRFVARDEVAAVYLIPPPVLGIMDKANPNTIKELRDITYTDSLGPGMILIEQAINGQVCRDLLREPDVFTEFDFTVVLRGDPLQQITVLREAIGTALLTPNEGRSVLGQAKSDNPLMDRFWMPTNNMTPIDQPRPTAAAPVVPIPIQPDQQGSSDPAGKRLHVRSRERDYEAAVDESAPW